MVWNRFKGKWGLIVAAIVAAAVLAPAAASANTITVNSTDDPSGTPADCTLHDAITAANTDAVVIGSSCAAGTASGTDTINFNLAGASPITLAQPLPDISTNINIVGPGSGQLTIDGVDTYRPFKVSTSLLVASITGVTVANGFCNATCTSGAVGAGIYNAGTLTLTDVVVTGSTASVTGGTNAIPEGGGIYTAFNSTLHLVLSTVSGNSAMATNATSVNNPHGGGILNNNATLTLDRSTVAGNSAVADAGGVGAETSAAGGGIDEFGGSITITQSTISGNSATGTGATGNGAQGGGITMGNTANITLSLDRATVTGNSVSAAVPVGGSNSGGGIVAIGGAGSAFTVVSSTISGNTAPVGANVVMGAAMRSFKNSIVSNPHVGANCNSTNSGSLGFNLEDTNSCGFTQPGDQHDINPMLDVLAANGGPTQTMAFLTGSPAIDAGLSSAGELADQRGMTRPLDLAAVPNAPASDGTDIGAFEDQGPAVTPPPAGNPTTTPRPASPPDTSLSARIRKRKRKATFTFGSADAGTTFMCKLDKRPFSPCTSPIIFRHLRIGRHTFAVEAKDAAGNVDPSPATFSFRLKA
jgi:hypothetical protein